LSWSMAFCPMRSPPSGSLALVIFPLLTVIVTCTGPYWVLAVPPLKVPDGPDGALLAGALGVADFVGAGALLVAVLAGAVGMEVCAGVVAGAVVFLAVACALADFVADGLVAGGFIVGVGSLGDTAGEAADSVAGAVSAATVGTWVLYENSAASPATVPPRARTARRI
jgi:hypothetical protein